MALKVGLTGGVACGKTTVGEMFSRHGAHVIQADKIAHLLMQKDTPVYVQIVKAFGARPSSMKMERSAVPSSPTLSLDPAAFPSSTPSFIPQ